MSRERAICPDLGRHFIIRIVFIDERAAGREIHRWPPILPKPAPHPLIPARLSCILQSGILLRRQENGNKHLSQQNISQRNLFLRISLYGQNRQE
jgi:hypothetical protein